MPKLNSIALVASRAQGLIDFNDALLIPAGCPGFRDPPRERPRRRGRGVKVSERRSKIQGVLLRAARAQFELAGAAAGTAVEEAGAVIGLLRPWRC